jgi:hypothetical protein
MPPGLARQTIEKVAAQLERLDAPHIFRKH